MHPTMKRPPREEGNRVMGDTMIGLSSDTAVAGSPTMIIFGIGAS